MLQLRTLDRTFEWVYTLFCVWYVFGLFLDGWAHTHISRLETFFTPWHAIFYSGYFLTTGTLMLWTSCRRRVIGAERLNGGAESGRGRWAEAIPDGYGLSLLGALVFLFGGIGDMLWHEIFGIEDNIEALTSPTHLLLEHSQ